MKRLLSLPKVLFLALLRYPRVTVAIGVFLLTCLVWIAGPGVGITRGETRLFLIVGILFLWIFFLLFDQYRAGRGAKMLEKSLQKQAEAQVDSTRPDRKGEIENLRNHFDKAVASLKQSKLGQKRSGASALYALPWYMFIGPPASGKSTALLHSGLQFPYLGSSGKGVQGVGGTRNCDWWFTSEAVLLDTAGRYVTEDEDREEWVGFLGLLKEYRKRKPINGVLAAVSITDLLQASESELEEHAKNIRNRIDELIQHLGILFPVYLIFTKCDLLHGFVEFFEDLGKNERDQVWGSTFPLRIPSGKSLSQVFDAEFQGVCDALHARRMTRLAGARGSQKIRDIYGFPLQLASSGEKLTRFVELLSQPNPYHENPIFRGFYFTSGTQEGTPIDRILSAVSRASGLPDVISGSFEAQTEPKSYFIKNLFTDIIFPDQILAGRSSAMERQRGYLRLGIFVGAVLATVLSIAGLSFSFAANKHLVSSIRSTAVTAVRLNVQDDRKFTKNIEQMAAVSDRLQQLENYDKEGVPFGLRGGLYRGGKFPKPLAELYFERFNMMFVEPTRSAIELELEAFVSNPDNLPADRDSDYYYSSLKAYLMMSDPSHLDPDFLSRWLQKIWGESLSAQYGRGGVPKELWGAISRQIAFYSRQLGGGNVPLIHPDTRLVKESQHVLRGVPLVERLYTRIRREAGAGLPPYTLETLFGDNSQDVLTGGYQIPGLFTKGGWQTSFRDTMARVLEVSGNEGWVLGVSQPPPAEMEKGIEKLYYVEYAAHWLKFLDAVEIQPADSPGDAAKRLEILTEAESPLKTLLVEAAVQTDLEEKRVSQGGQGGVTVALLQKVKKGLRLSQGEESSLRTADLNPLAARFRPLHEFVSLPADPKGPAPVDLYFQELVQVHDLTRSVASSESIGQEDLKVTGLAAGGSTAIKKIEKLIPGSDPESRGVLLSLLIKPVKMSYSGIMRQALVALNEQWTAEVYEICSESIGSHYPFNVTGEDVSVADLADFFHPQNGVIWKFYESQLKSFVEEGKDRWEVKPSMENSLPLSAEFLENLRNARLITDSLFPRGNPDVKLSFELYPYPSPGVSEILFQVDGTNLRYRNEPQEWHEMTWPGSAGAAGASLQVSFGGNRLVKQYSGRWGFFKLLDAGQVTPAGSHYQVEWNMAGPESKPFKVRYNLRGQSYKNPFKPDLFKEFKCISQVG